MDMASSAIWRMREDGTASAEEEIVADIVDSILL
jgi:hypothetical protein